MSGEVEMKDGGLRELDASQIREILPSVSSDYFGLTGYCGLDVYGDRQEFQMGLYGYGYDPNPRWILVGYFYSPENTVIWEKNVYEP